MGADEAHQAAVEVLLQGALELVDARGHARRVGGVP
jgi:hypothetical protein